MIEINGGIKPNLPDATFDLDGTVFKLTILESYVGWLCEQGIFDPIPQEIINAKQSWKLNNTEQNYIAHLNLLVEFFVCQISNKSVALLSEAANIVASQQKHRRWNIIVEIINALSSTHNIISVSMMPEWLMKPFVSDLGFMALIGSIYVVHEGVFTGEAKSIDKKGEYAKNRPKDNLDYHFGDTVSDFSLFELAKHPVFFNPSNTLFQMLQQPKSKFMLSRSTVLTSHKDVVTVSKPSNKSADFSTTFWGAPFNIETIIKGLE